MSRRNSTRFRLEGCIRCTTRGLTLEGGYLRRPLSKAAPHTGQSSPRVGMFRTGAPYERVAGPVATYTASVPERLALTHPRLALLSKNPNFSRLGTPLFCSVGTRSLRRAPSSHSSRTATPIPSGSKRGWSCVSGIYDPRLAIRGTLHVRMSRELRPAVVGRFYAPASTVLRLVVVDSGSLPVLR